MISREESGKVMLEPYSPIAPARIRTLVVPIGSWTRKQFLEKVELLQQCFEIRLLDITPIENASFNPQGFPQGRLLFDFQTTGDESQEQISLFLHDFEPFRKTFVVIGLVNEDDNDPRSTLQELKKRYSNSIYHSLIYYNSPPDPSPSDNVFFSKETAMETIMCDIGRCFLESLGHYYSSYKHVTLRSPGAIGGNSVMKTALVRQSQVPSSTSTATISKMRITSLPMDVGSNTNGLKRSTSLKSLGLNSSTTGADNKTQQRSRARQAKILGNFQLLAGRYMDALFSFSEAATVCYKLHDHLWLGNALEGIYICILLLSYLQVSFQVPHIVSLLVPYKTLTHSISTTPSSRRNSFSPSRLQSPRNSLNTLNSLNATPSTFFDINDVVIPVLIKNIGDKIFHYYELTLQHNSEYTPQLVYCETILRILKFMTACHLGHDLDMNVLKQIVLSQPISTVATNSMDPPAFTKLEIYRYSNRLFELQLKEMDVMSQANVYVTLASIYGDLGFERKRCFILRLLFVSLLPKLNDSGFFWDDNYEALLETILQTYGLHNSPESSIRAASSCSWVTLQKNVLMLCVALAQKTNDLASISKFSVLLLTRYSHVLTQTEQNKLLLENILPSISQTLTTQYWDPFLLRNVTFKKSDHSINIPLKKFVTRKEKCNSAVPHQLFNPFKQKQISTVTDISTNESKHNCFLVGEKAEFICTLQNPFKFDLEITQLELSSQDSEVLKISRNEIAPDTPLIIKGSTMKLVSLQVTFIKETEGKQPHTLEKLNIGVFGLAPCSFNIAKRERFSTDEIMAISDKDTTFNERCLYDKLQFEVLREQPELEFFASDLKENSCMLLHGTKRKFTVSLRNKSLGCTANYLEITHLTNVEKFLKDDYWRKMHPDDLYEIESQLRWLQLECIKFLNQPQEVKPNEIVTFEVEIDASCVPFQFSGFDLIVEYGMRDKEDEDTVYTKKLRLPFEVTLKKSIEIPHMDIVPLTENFSPEMYTVGWIRHLMSKIERNNESIHDYALLLLDMRNSWINGLSIKLEYDDFITEQHTIEPEHTTRLIVPVKKIPPEADFANKPIPKLVQGRQFIQSGLSQERISGMQESFWCRETMIGMLKCQWFLNSDVNVNGFVDFRQFLNKIDARTLTILYSGREPYQLKLSINKHEASVGDIISLCASVRAIDLINDNPVPLTFMFFDRRTGKILPRSNKRILYNGKLSSNIQAKYQPEIKLDILPLERGEYEIGCCINGSNFNETPVYLRVK